MVTERPIPGGGTTTLGGGTAISGGGTPFRLNLTTDQPPTLSGWHTRTVDKIEVASSLNFSILVECSLLNACECMDFIS